MQPVGNIASNHDFRFFILNLLVRIIHFNEYCNNITARLYNLGHS